MRITNKIMQRNNLSNINTNKIYQDRLSNQMSTQKKINRPSDDPVVAIRALRLRSSVTEITQYYSKNIPDATSWLEVTEDALHNLSEVVKDMRDQCVKGSQDGLTSANRQIILEQLEKLGEEVYATGDADYAGRYVFTGYRTDTPLSFKTADDTPYEITEQLDSSSITSLTHVDTGRLLDWNTANFNDATLVNGTAMKDIKEQDITTNEVYRIRLAYDNCDAGYVPTVKIWDNTATPPDYTAMTAPVIAHNYDSPSPYEQISDPANDNAMIFVPETGELLLGKNVYSQLASLRDDPSSANVNEGEIRITYQKNDWLKGDLRPEHYFACTTNKGTADELKYNSSYLEGIHERQEIEYDVGFNQTIRVNSTADECFQHGIGREVDDLVASLREVLNLEAVQAKIKAAQEGATGADAEILEKQMEAVNKALALSKDKCQKLFGQGISTFQKYLDDATLCITNCGTRSSKLELIENRMQSQKTTFETLKSENEDIDITEVAIELNSAELTYEAALMATGKVMQTTLLNFI